MYPLKIRRAVFCSWDDKLPESLYKVLWFTKHQNSYHSGYYISGRLCAKV